MARRFFSDRIFNALVEGGDPLGMIPQGLRGEEGQEVDDPFAAARAQGVFAGVELGEDEEHLVVQGHLTHRGASVQAVLSQARQACRQEIQVLHPIFGHHLQGVGGADLGADAAALAGRGIGIEVHGEALPGDALGRLLETLK